jgi:hypothetical protein
MSLLHATWLPAIRTSSSSGQPALLVWADTWRVASPEGPGLTPALHPFTLGSDDLKAWLTERDLMPGGQHRCHRLPHPPKPHRQTPQKSNPIERTSPRGTGLDRVANASRENPFRNKWNGGPGRCKASRSSHRPQRNGSPVYPYRADIQTSGMNCAGGAISNVGPSAWWPVVAGFPKWN